MTARPILRLGARVLRTPAAEVTAFDDALRTLVADLMDTLDAAPGRAGIAAPQIGVGLRVFGFDADGTRGHLVNPVITARHGGQLDPEGCLSVPGMAYPTARARRVTVAGRDGYGAPLTLTVEGFVARVLQHETDHLDGVLYLDRLAADVRRRARRAVRAAPWALRAR